VTTKYRGLSLLPTTYKILSNSLISRLTSYVDDITGDHQCIFQHNRSTTDQIFCICQIWEKIWKHNGTVHQLFTDSEKAYVSVTRKVLQNILAESGIPTKLVT
jgi:hypothetical protein